MCHRQPQQVCNKRLVSEGYDAFNMNGGMMSWARSGLKNPQSGEDLYRSHRPNVLREGDINKNSEVKWLRSFLLRFHYFIIVCDLDRIPERGINRAILLFADPYCLGKLFKVNVFADGLIMNMYFPKTPGRVIILCAFGGHFEFAQVLPLLFEEFQPHPPMSIRSKPLRAYPMV